MRRKSGSMAVRNFLSLLSLPGSLRPLLRVCRRLASRAPDAAARGLSHRASSGLTQAECGVRVPRPPRPLDAQPTPPTRSHPAAAARGWSGGAGPGPRSLPPTHSGFSDASPPRSFVCFLISPLSCVGAAPLAP